ncbi:MAG: endonuclease MutS2, partial [Anaerolineae bacterium]|nr:endonuclease MutS2 [Anaerolineae bacterium]
MLLPEELLDIRGTLIAARTMHRNLTRLDTQFPYLAKIASGITFCPDVIAEIGRCLDDRGEVRDDASDELARIRREVRIAHDRIQDKLQRIISSPRNAPVLQDLIITQRNGRYVIPVKADFKGRIQGVVHDVSASGATVFLEPLSAVALNNEWRELEIKEQQEIRRILAELSDLVASQSHDITQAVNVLGDLDLVFAKAKYAEALRASPPKLVGFRKPEAKENGYQHPGSTLRLLGARHPLIDPKQVVAIDVEGDDDTSILVITGPNTGGKTVSLKTAGLLGLMAQAGLHIPAEPTSVISPFDEIYADIGDEQSIEQSLSTFSAHLTNITSFLDKADEHSLVLLDELGAGTDPAEGSALARALLEHLRSRRVTAFVATHYPELKSYAQLTPGVQNACVEFDPETLRPTYKLAIGLPGRSNAFAIAQHIGLSKDIVSNAQELVSTDSIRTEDMLADIHRLRIQAAQERERANKSRIDAEQHTRKLEERLKAIDQERQKILNDAETQSREELENLQKEMRSLRRRLQMAAAPLDQLIAVEEDMEDLEIQYSKPEPILPATRPVAQQK